jgi:hypothetical protein
MMIHSWHTQHIKVSFLDKQTGETHYLSPSAWTTRRRWSSHADMIYQYSKCISTKLKAYNHTSIELYFDVWRSLNHRFHQRLVDPRVDLLTAKWSAFEETQWILPLLTELSDWRTKMKELEDEAPDNTQLTFVSDFEGLFLENFIPNGLNTTIEVLNGIVNVEVVINDDKHKNKNKPFQEFKTKNITLKQGDKLQVTSDATHLVHTISGPSSYFYIHMNTTARILSDYYTRFEMNMNERYEHFLNQINSTINGPIDNEMIETAMNMTLSENAERFIYMITFNSTVDHFDVDAEIEKTKSLFKLNKFNVTTVYNHFISNYQDSFDERLKRVQQTNVQKLFQNTNKSLRRMKNRFPLYIYIFKFNFSFFFKFFLFLKSFLMIYYAFKSLIQREDFISMVDKELFSKYY